jgi:2'-5' RNA ligase
MDIKWEHAAKLHFTLKFLGDVSEEMVSTVEASLRATAERAAAFSAAFGGMGCFPSPKRPRVIWAGLRQGGDEMRLLQRSVEGELKLLGFRPEQRPFRPHMTVGRVKRRVTPVDLSSCTLPPDQFEIGEVILKKSTLTPKGSYYDDLCRCPLGPQGEQWPLQT